MGTHLHTCPPDAGWNWLRQGIQIFKTRPGEMLLLGNTYFFFIFLLGIVIPYVGQVLFTLFTPVLGLGMMQAGRMAKKNMRVLPIVLFVGFQKENRAHLKSLLTLGVFNTIWFTLVNLLGLWLFGAQPDAGAGPFEANGSPASLELIRYLVKFSSLVTACTLPIVIALWFAPVLMVWHNMKPLQALFSSCVAIWRNKSGFLVYGMGWVALSTGFCVVLILGSTLLGLSGNLIAALIVIATPFVIAVSVCTFYPSYEAIFENDQHHLAE